MNKSNPSIPNFPRLRNYINKLVEMAKKSDINHRHASVLIYNGNPVAWGYNSIKGINTNHAECDVIRRFLVARGFIGYLKVQKEQYLLRGLYQCQKGS